MSDTELIARILSGEEALFARIVNRYSGYVWAICSSYIRNPTDREDVAQEIFVRLYHSLGQLRSPELFEAWLNRIVANTTCDYLRRKRRSRRSPNARWCTATSACGI